MLNTTKKKLAAGITVALSIIVTGKTFAANVPAGVQLADASKQVLVRNNGSEPQSLDPHKIEGVPESGIARDLFETLVINDPDGNIIPGVAESWDSQQDFKVWTFHLRKEAKWSNGDPVTAQDFVYSFRRLVDPNTASPYASYMQYAHLLNVDEVIKGQQKPESLGVKALDNHTLQLTLSESVPYLARLFVHTSTSPVHRATIEKYGDRWTQPQNFVGNGAYKVKNWVINERLVLERSPNYWDNKNTIINQVTVLPISSEVTDVNRYRAGEIDMTYHNLPIELFQKLKKEVPDQLKVNPYLCTYFYEINNQKPPFNDPRVRTALKLGMDRDIITNKVKNQGDLVAYGFTPPFIADFKDEKPDWAFKMNQQQRNDEAKKLLAEAGFTKDNPLKIKLLYNTSDLHKKMAIAAASIWKKNIGIEVALENQEWKTYLDSRHQGNYDLARAGWCADYNESSSFLNSMLSNSSNNTAHYKSKEFDALMKQSLKVKTDEERIETYAKANALLDKDSAIVPLFYYANTRVIKPYVGGYTGKDPLDNFHAKDLYIIKH
ncbi:oligopeptide ABC transporter substrate-binding protein OppA [Xenorhabdus szentirmaii]|uniref:Periplasmic oligopeptide-binding protein OppA n=1 Tax=Xenorhabdus szentirmaii DSM 16338 TaxID=1427518 RepID=W1ISR2_9GAMM|nr:oligopeptide ABC transporter substrate-binding protein OppA [Xenorhabdus szentirmaii]PHM32489.1 periplasmic murein peptide-binding protein precursor [Xenorhabdus szentirmaii DSM 16338]CDL80671.1 oligopeptide transport protein (ABC superfamily,peri_bind) [Xenorhabdus szentirmaii DSM 16338]